MPEVLSILEAPAMLLFWWIAFATFLSGGLLGWWAANSHLHWFWRTVIVLTIIGPLLLRPMFEPFFALLTEIALVAAGVSLLRHRNQIAANFRNGLAESVPRFSIRTLLLITPLVAMLAAVTVAALQEVAVRNLVGAMVTGIVATAIFLPAVALLDETLPRRPRIILGVLAFPLWPVVLLLMPWKLAYRESSSSTSRFVFTAIATGVTLCVFALPVYIAIRLLNPLPIPIQEPLADNCYDDLVALGKQFKNSGVMREYAAEPVVKPRLAAAVAANKQLYDKLPALLDRECQVPISFDITSMDTDGTMARRNLARALYIRGRLAEDRGDYHTALESHLRNYRLSEMIRDGLIIDWLIGIALEGMADGGIYEIRDSLNGNQCRTTIAYLVDFDNNRIPIDRIKHYEEVYMNRAFGWTGHLSLLCAQLTDTESSLILASAGEIRNRIQAQNRLLTTEIALRLFELEKGKLPTVLEELVPDYLPMVPLDPFDPAEKPLSYLRTEDGYILYSIGFDGEDDGGTPPPEMPRDDYQDWTLGDGDLRLDFFIDNPLEDEWLDEEPTTDPNEPDYTVEDFDAAEEIAH